MGFYSSQYDFAFAHGIATASRYRVGQKWLASDLQEDAQGFCSSMYMRGGFDGNDFEDLPAFAADPNSRPRPQRLKNAAQSCQILSAHVDM